MSTQTCHNHFKALTLQFILFLQLLFLLLNSGVGHDEGLAAGKRLVPMKTEPEFRAGVDLITGGGGRRRLDAFQLCSECKCCEAPEDTTNCTTTSCCFGIDCQLPNKPFGVCAFVPKACNCTSCNVI